MTVTLRPALGADAAACAKIMGDWIIATPYLPSMLHTAAENVQFLRRKIAAGGVIVAETDHILGYIDRNGADIDQLYLAVDARRQGIGTLLLQTAKAASPTLSLWCFQQNIQARAFYEHHGFRAEKMTDGARNDEKTSDVFYVWEQSS